MCSDLLGMLIVHLTANICVSVYWVTLSFTQTSVLNCNFDGKLTFKTSVLAKDKVTHCVHLSMIAVISAVSYR